MTDFPSNFFFDEEETEGLLEEFGILISWINPSGSLQGTDEETVHGVIDSTITIERDDLIALVPIHSTVMRVKTEDGKQMRNDSIITIGGERWTPNMDQAERIDDGSIMLIPIHRAK